MALGLYLYLHPAEPVTMPTLPVRNRSTIEQWKAASPVGDPQPERPRQGEVGSGQTAADAAPPARRPIVASGPIPLGDTNAPGNPVVAEGGNADAGPPASAIPEAPGDAMPASPGPADAIGKGAAGETPVQVQPGWPNQWKLQFAGSSGGTIDNELMSLSADELKTLAALREQPIYTLRDAITKKPTAELPFDTQGHLSGTVVALLPSNDCVPACRTAIKFCTAGQEFSTPSENVSTSPIIASKAALASSASAPEGVPVAVQIWRGKDAVAYLVELAEGRPVAREQTQLSAEQTERLGTALAELASIEALIRDCEKDWKSQLSDWWKTHDNALRAISVQSIPDGEKQSRRIAYYKKLFDDQHAGIDKLLTQFEPVAVDPAGPK